MEHLLLKHLSQWPWSSWMWLRLHNLTFSGIVIRSATWPELRTPPPPSGMVSPWSFTTALQAVHLCRLFRSFQLFSRLTSFYLIKIALYPEVKCVILHFSSIYLFHRFIFSNSRQSFSQTSTLFIWQIIFVPANDKLLLRDESTHFLCFSILHSCFLFFSS